MPCDLDVDLLLESFQVPSLHIDADFFASASIWPESRKNIVPVLPEIPVTGYWFKGAVIIISKIQL